MVRTRNQTSRPRHRHKSDGFASNPTARAIGLGSFLALSSCQAVPGDKQDDATGAPSASDGSSSTDDPTTLAPGEMLGDGTTAPGLRRLTQLQYQNTMLDLLGVTVDREAVPREQIIEGHGHIAAAQMTGYEDAEGFYSVALATAEAAVDTWLGSCAADACAQDLAARFLYTAFRGPVDQEVSDDYRSILSDEEAGATLRERAVTYLTAVLSSPYFLYRREIGDPARATADGAERNVRPLSDFEIVSRLSYLVWQGPPDAELLAAAESGLLTDVTGRSTELERLLGDPRATRGLVAFARDWLGLFDNPLSQKHESVLEGTPSDLPERAESSFDRTVSEVLGTVDAGYVDLLTTQRLVLDPELAALYGLSVSIEGNVDLPDASRGGVLTHPLVLAAHTKESGASPFPVGKFIFENLLCETIPPPPPDIPTLEDVGEASGTLREQLEVITSAPSCTNCHRRIGPPGFAFLPFDPIGRYSPSDSLGRPYDTTGELFLEDGEVLAPFSNVGELGSQLAQQDQSLSCVGKRVFRFAYGRFESDADAERMDALDEVAINQTTRVVSLLESIVSSEHFAQVEVLP